MSDGSQDRLLETVDKLNSQLKWPGQIGFIVVCAIESIPVDCNHYFQLLNKFKLSFLSSCCNLNQLVIATALPSDYNNVYHLWFEKGGTS